MKIAIIVSDFNSQITSKMLDAAIKEARKQDLQIKHLVRVPGVLEIPFALKKILKKKDIGAVATIGAVLQGKTEHDRLVAYTAAEKITALSLEYEKPVSVGITGPRMTRKQAMQRAYIFGKRSIETLIDLRKNLKILD